MATKQQKYEIHIKLRANWVNPEVYYNLTGTWYETNINVSTNVVVGEIWHQLPKSRTDKTSRSQGFDGRWGWTEFLHEEQSGPRTTRETENLSSKTSAGCRVAPTTSLPNTSE